MATTEQIDANRQNARKSTGPRSAEGKAASRFNALKSGIDAEAEVIPGEDPAKLEALIAEYRERWPTDTPERRMLVDTLVNCEWMLRRIRRGEASFWKYKEERTFLDTPNREGRVIDFGDMVYDRLQRRINSIQRNYLRALKELQTLEKTQATAPGPQPLDPASQSPAPGPRPPAPDPAPGPWTLDPDSAPGPEPLDPDPAPGPRSPASDPVSQIGFVPQSIVRPAPAPPVDRPGPIVATLRPAEPQLRLRNWSR